MDTRSTAMTVLILTALAVGTVGVYARLVTQTVRGLRT